MTDSTGIHGLYLHYALLFSLFGSALITFIYLWRTKRLDIDEEAKYTMMEEDD